MAPGDGGEEIKLNILFSESEVKLKGHSTKLLWPEFNFQILLMLRL